MKDIDTRVALLKETQCKLEGLLEEAHTKAHLKHMCQYREGVDVVFPDGEARPLKEDMEVFYNGLGPILSQFRKDNDEQDIEAVSDRCLDLSAGSFDGANDLGLKLLIDLMSNVIKYAGPEGSGCELTYSQDPSTSAITREAVEHLYELGICVDHIVDVFSETVWLIKALISSIDEEAHFLATGEEKYEF